MLPLTPHRKRAAVIGLAAAALLAGSTTTALAAAPAAGHEPKSDGARQICKRLPKVDKRLNRAIERLDGGAGVTGSVERLEKRIDNAKSQGDTAIASYLGHRLTTRKSLVSTVKQRQDDLKDVKSWCAAHDNGKKNNKKASAGPSDSSDASS